MFLVFGEGRGYKKCLVFESVNMLEKALCHILIIMTSSSADGMGNDFVVLSGCISF